MTDAELLARLALGEQTAFQLLYERHWNAVYRFAWLLTKSVPDAEDVTQDCFLALARKPDAYNPARAQLRTWLIAVAKNLCYQRFALASRTESLPDENRARCEPRIEEQMIREQNAEAVRHALSQLPVAQQEALFLFDFEQMSLAETAAALQIEPNAVKARLHRARQALKRVFQQMQPQVIHEQERG
jgi:RNA polymerase sigma-70 factor (ECF subfamily)